jgi:transcriptional regulator with XRE-family HTH domain
MGKLTEGKSGRQRARPQDIDRHVGARLRQRRIALGLNQQQMADLIGVTCQQAYKYEKGINRISAGRLYIIAKVLDVEIEFFFRGLQDDQDLEPVQEPPLQFEVVRNFASLTNRHHRAALSAIVRALANANAGQSTATGAKPNSDVSAT